MAGRICDSFIDLHNFDEAATTADFVITPNSLAVIKQLCCHDLDNFRIIGAYNTLQCIQYEFGAVVDVRSFSHMDWS